MQDRMAVLSDEELVTYIQQENNTDAFVELSVRYMGLIRAKASSFFSSGLEPDDFLQEGLLALQSAARNYKKDGNASFRTYAGICIVNRIVTVHRSSAGKKNQPLNNSVSLDDDLESRFTLDEVANPETLLINRENLQIVRSRIHQTLSKMEQQVLSLYLDGYSYVQISKKLNLSVKAADNAIQRVRRKLKNSF